MSRQERILGPLPDGHTESCLQLAKLVTEKFPDYRPEEFAVGVELAVRRGEAIAALWNNRVLGLLLLSRREGELLFLAVHPSARRMGLARRLIDRGLSRTACAGHHLPGGRPSGHCRPILLPLLRLY